MQATAAAKKETDEKPKAYTFSLKTPYMKQGRVTQLVAETAERVDPHEDQRRRRRK